MTFDAGRIRHDDGLMHYARQSNGTAVPSNWIRSTDGTTAATWRPESAGSVSYGSNSNDVTFADAAGASTLLSRADHAHRGVTSLSHSSNTYTGPVTLETEGSLYIVRSAANTYRLGASGTTSGGASSGSDLVEVASGAGSVRIPGIAVPDRVPASPNAKDDEFDALSGWTTLGTLDTSNVSDFASHYHLKRTSSAANVDGIYKTAPSMPFTVTAKLASTNIDNGSPGHRSVGILLADATPTALALIEYNFATTGNFDISCRKWTNRTTFSSALNDTVVFVATSMVATPMPFYLRALVTSSTSVTISFSLDGFIYHTTATVNPGISFANVGLSVSCPVDGSGNTVEGIFDWIRFS